MSEHTLFNIHGLLRFYADTHYICVSFKHFDPLKDPITHPALNKTTTQLFEGSRR